MNDNSKILKDIALALHKINKIDKLGTKLEEAKKEELECRRESSRGKICERRHSEEVREITTERSAEKQSLTAIIKRINSSVGNDFSSEKPVPFTFDIRYVTDCMNTDDVLYDDIQEFWDATTKSQIGKFDWENFEPEDTEDPTYITIDMNKFSLILKKHWVTRNSKELMKLIEEAKKK